MPLLLPPRLCRDLQQPLLLQVRGPDDVCLGAAQLDLWDMRDGQQHDLEAQLEEGSSSGAEDAAAEGGRSTSSVRLSCRFVPFAELLGEEGAEALVEGQPLLATAGEVGHPWLCA